MSDQPIAPDVLEAAERAYSPCTAPTPREEYVLRGAMEAAIRAADEARGLTVEERGDRPGIRRLVGPWVPVGGEAQDVSNAVRGGQWRWLRTVLVRRGRELRSPWARRRTR